MILRATTMILALAAASLAWGQQYDPPARLAQLAYVEGELTFEGAGERPITTLPNRPLTAGDRFATEPRGRAELTLGSATIRLDEGSELAILDLDAKTVRLELAAGSTSVYLRDLLEDELFEVVTPNAAIALLEPGEYRVDIETDTASALTVHGGAAEIASASGPIRISGEQRVRLEGRDALARLEAARPNDAFDEWVLERELRVAEAEPAQYTPYDDGSYQELDRYGEWYDEPRYGRVWMPSYGYSNWSPYRGGYWQRAGFGWSWINPAPWGYYTYYSGRWAYLHHLGRWCWVPSPRHHHHRYYARDTRPYGPSRGHWRDRDRRHDDEPRDRPRRPRRDEPRGPGAGPGGDAPPPDVDRRRERRAEASREQWRPPGVYQRRADPPRAAPSASRPERAPQRQAAEAPRGGRATLRPSRAPEARAERSADSGANTRRAFGRRQPD